LSFVNYVGNLTSVSRVDLKTLMAEAMSSKQSQSTITTPVQRAAAMGSDPTHSALTMGSQGIPQQERFKTQGKLTAGGSREQNVLVRPSKADTSPWRTSSAQAPINLSEAAFPPVSGTPHVLLPSLLHSKDVANSSSARLTLDLAKKPKNPDQLQRTQAGLGPTFTPSRQAPNAGSSIRRVS
jgi:hypothetical protein